MRGSSRLAAPILLSASLFCGALCYGCAESDSRPELAGDRAPDVFVIVLDTARQDAYSIFNDKTPIGRSLAGLARDAVVLEDLRAPSSWTRTSVASLLTGLTPAKHQVFGRNDVLPDDLTTLAGHLRANGYETLGWSANPNVLPLWGFGAGFDALVDAGRRNPKDSPPRAAEVFALARESILARAGEPREAGPSFYYLHLIDPHAPYAPPSDQLRAVKAASDALVETFPVPLTGKRAKALWSGQYLHYLAEIRDLDEQLGLFFEFLAEHGLYESSLILVVSDHGEEFLDHGGLRHGRTLYEEVLRVPGVLKLPGNRRAGTRLGATADMHDLLPTISRALGLEIPPGSQGRALFDPEPVEARPRVFNLVLDGRRLAALRFESWKLIVDYESGLFELYDLEQDPEEKYNLAEREPARVAELRAILDRMSARHAEGWHLRACGCKRRSELRFAIQGVSADPETLLLEENDHVAIGEDGVVRVALVLQPLRWTSEGMRIPRRVVVGDRDELHFTESTKEVGSAIIPGLALRAEESRELRYALGNGRLETHQGWLELATVAATARLSPSEPLLCMPDAGAPWSPEPTEECEPHLRIWYTKAQQQLPASAVDPEIIERLKALGYDW